MIDTSDDSMASLPQCTRRMAGWSIQPDVVDFLETSRDLQHVPTNIETSMLAIYPAGKSPKLISFLILGLTLD
jgi:hypothetical protein